VLQRVLPASKLAWDDDQVTRLAVERLWITAGNTAQEYRRTAGIDIGIESFRGLLSFPWVV